METEEEDDEEDATKENMTKKEKATKEEKHDIDLDKGLRVAGEEVCPLYCNASIIPNHNEQPTISKSPSLNIEIIATKTIKINNDQC